MNLIEQLTKLANALDQKGLYVEADEIDELVKKLMANPKFNQQYTLTRKEPAPQTAAIPPLTTSGPAPQSLTDLGQPPVHTP